MEKIYSDTKAIMNVTRNFSSMIGANIIYKAITFIMMIAIARFLGVERFGQISYGMSLAWIFLFLSDLGLSELFVRDVSADHSLLKKYINNIITFKILIAAVNISIITLLAWSLSGEARQFWMIMLLGAAVIFDSFMYFFRFLFRVRETMQYEAILMVIEAFLKIGAVVLMMNKLISLPAIIVISLALLVVSVINFFISLVVFILNYHDFSFSFNFRFWLYLLRDAKFFVFISILSLLNFRVDVIMLSFIKGNTYAGLFNANYKLIEQFLLIPLILSAALLPTFSKLSRSFNSLKVFFRKIILFNLCIGTLCLLLIFVFGEPAIKIIYGDLFVSAGRYMALFSLILLPFFIKVPLETLLLSLRKQVALFFIYLAGTVMNIVLNFAMIPKIGINGASLATVTSEIMVVIACLFTYKKLTIIPVPDLAAVETEDMFLVKK